MGYTALYRKFRPAGFDEVKGQEHIVTTLKNQIKSERVGHAYLFCGTRGTGKTTIAKILAKAVNCEHPVDGSPCGECLMCRKIAGGTSMNVIEIDAASNNGVDNIREIIDEVQYSPTEGRYKVYIIDEVHMLSQGAFNALLKTLEEPPSYVIFILATTEAHKIPITILSRCQRYDFRRISIDTIALRLAELMEREGTEADENALRFVAKSADGSMRDALSLLDQCLAFYFGEKLTYDKVMDVLGAVDTEVFGSLFRAIVAGNVNGCMDQVEALVTEGRDLAQFAVDFTWYFRNLLLAATSDAGADRLGVSTEQMARLKEEAQLALPETLIRDIRVLSELSGQLRYASQKRAVLEVALIKLCKPEMEADMGSLTERLRSLEERLEGMAGGAGYPGMWADGQGGYPGMGSGVQGMGYRGMEAELPGNVGVLENVPGKLEKAVTEDLKEIGKNWNKILAGLPPLLRTMLKSVKPSAGENGILLLVFSEALDKASVESEAHMAELKGAVASCVGKEVEIRTLLEGDGNRGEQSFPDLSKLIKAEIEYVD